MRISVVRGSPKKKELGLFDEIILAELAGSRPSHLHYRTYMDFGRQQVYQKVRSQYLELAPRCHDTNSAGLELRYPAVMGILNLTPDSFSDGGDFDTEAAIEHALSMVEAGAQIIDLGEKALVRAVTRYPMRKSSPGLFRSLKTSYRQFVLSIDTTKPTVAGQLCNRAHAINAHRAETPNYSTWPRVTGPALFSCMLKALEEHAGPAGV